MFKEPLPSSTNATETSENTQEQNEHIPDAVKTETTSIDTEELTRLKKADDIKTENNLAEVRKQLDLETTDTTDYNSPSTTTKNDFDPKIENSPIDIEDSSPKEYELEYNATIDNVNLMKQGLTSSVFENSKEINTLDLGSVLEAELQAKPLNYDLYQGEAYNVDLFLDDTTRLPNLSMIVEIAHEEMSAKLEFAKEQKKQEGDENADLWYQQKMEELWNAYKEADDKIDELIIAIEDAHDPEGAQRHKNERTAHNNESQQLQQGHETKMEEMTQLHEAKMKKQKQMYEAKMEEIEQIQEAEMKKLADKRKEILVENFDQEIIDAETVGDIELAVTQLDAKDYTNEVFANDIDKLTQYTRKQVITNNDISDVSPILEQMNQKLTAWAAMEVGKNEA